MTIVIKEFNSNLQAAFSSRSAMRLWNLVDMHWSERLKKLTKQRNWTAKELSRRSGVNVEILRKCLQGNVDKPRGDTTARLARALGVSVVWLEYGLGPASTNLPVVGYVGAGEAFFPADAGVIDELAFDFARLDLLAVQIRGTSGLPAYRPGEIIVCSRAAGQLESGFINQDCIVMTRDGAGYLKKPVRGARHGRYTLLSYNAAPIEDVELDWAAPVVFVVRLPNLLSAV